MKALKKNRKIQHLEGSIRDKVKSIEELSDITKKLKLSGKTVVHAHGTFDLLHYGHLKYLEASREYGDVLIVTITADKFVNKGPNRPVFAQELRAEMLAALGIVDWVGINNHLDAVPAIRKIKPDIYAKGQDYKNPGDDITGKIVDETKEVEKYGGQVIFTNEDTFSSTELLNRHFNVFEPHTRAYLKELRENNGAKQILSGIDKIKDYSVLIIGDAIIDEYTYVHPIGKSAKENMIATRYQNNECFAGGVFATANHVASFCKHVEVVTVLGGDDSYEKLIKENLKPNVKLTAITREGAPTTRKQRFVDPGYMRKLFEVYYMNDNPLVGGLQGELNNILSKKIGDYDVVIANDFGHGMMDLSTIDMLTKHSRFLAVNCQSNSANLGYNLITKYSRADYVCIDLPEARLAVSDKISPIEEIVGSLLPDKIDCSNFVITSGKHGCVTYQRGGVLHTIPAFSKSAIDTVGAGDAFLSVSSPLVASGMPLNLVGLVGNVVGALKIKIVGHRESVSKTDVIKSIKSLLR